MAVVLGLLATAGCCFLAVGEVEKQGNGNGAFSSSSSSGGEDGGGSKKNHTVVVVVLVTLTAVVVFSALLLLLLRWLLLKRWRGRRSRDGDGGGGGGAGGVEDGTALQRQLQQLFHLHDAGLDQDVIDALPVFTYREVAKEPFDCAVCLCEFAAEDRLRLLPPCGHAFHVDCIDTWLLSNSTCPLCRCALGADAVLLDAFGFGGGEVDGAGGWKHAEDAAAVIPVRLGKFKSTAAGPVAGGEGIVTREAGETSSSSLDARRCYSMGSYQYVLAEASLQVSVHRRNGRAAAAAAVRARGAANPEPAAEREGKRIGAGSKGDSFSVSKIWQWPRNGKGKLPVLASDDSPSVNGGRMPWHRRSPGDS